MRILPRSLAVALVVALGMPVLFDAGRGRREPTDGGCDRHRCGCRRRRRHLRHGAGGDRGVVAALRQQSGQQLTPATQFDGFAITTSDH